MGRKRDTGFWLWVLTCIGWACYLGFGGIHISVAVGLSIVALVSLSVRTLTQEQQLFSHVYPLPIPVPAPALTASPYRESARFSRKRSLHEAPAQQLVASVLTMSRHRAVQLLLDLPLSSRRATRGMLKHRVGSLEQLVSRVLLEQCVSDPLSQALLKQLLQNRTTAVQQVLLMLTTDTTTAAAAGDKPC